MPDFSGDIRYICSFNPASLPIANGEMKGKWVRDAYVCGYLKYISDGKYKLLSIGTGFESFTTSTFNLLTKQKAV